MGLVEIAATIGNIGPHDTLPRVNLGQHLLKSADPAEQLGSQPDFATKLRDEMLMAHAELGRDGANTLDLGSAHEPGEGPGYFLRAFPAAPVMDEVLHQELLKQR